MSETDGNTPSAIAATASTHFVRWFVRNHAVHFLVGINLTIYVLMILADPQGVGFHGSVLSYGAPSLQLFDAWGASGSIAVFGEGRWWTIFTANYLHIGVTHLFLNLAGLYFLGDMVNTIYGTHRMIIIYCIAGPVSMLVSSYMGVPTTVGASGAIFGLAGALIYGDWHCDDRSLMALFQDIGVWILVLAAFAMVDPYSNNWAHFAGLATGFFLGVSSYAVKRVADIPLRFYTWAVYGFIVITGLGFLLAAAT